MSYLCASARRFAALSQSVPLTVQIVTVLIVTSLTVSSSVMAGSGGVVTLPRGAAKNGLHLEIESIWPDVQGPRPFRITVTPATRASFKRDREIEVRLQPYSYSYYGRGGDFSTTRIELPEGKNSVTKTVYANQDHVFRELRVETREGGKLLDDLSRSNSNFANPKDERLEGVPSVLVIDVNAPMRADRSNLTAYRNSKGQLPNIYGLKSRTHSHSSWSKNGTPDDEDVLNEIIKSQYLELLPPDDLPPDWIGLAGIDLIVFSLDELSQISDRQPDAVRRVRDYLLAGGNVLVYGTGANFEGLAEIESLFQLRPFQAASDSVIRGWGSPSRAAKTHRVEVLDASAVHVIESSDAWERTAKLDDRKKTRQPARTTKISNVPFVMREASLGVVIALKSDELPEEETWSWILNSMDSKQWSWYRRHGISLSRENDDFWNFVTAKLGLAPVNAFLVLITLFVIAIGPLNYIFLKRVRRLSWMLVTVPLGALLVTLGLFAYAILTDGFAVRSRVRSLTHLDQRSGHAVSWSRQAYYAGIAPSSGLSYPNDSMVIYMDQFPNNRSRNQNVRIREMNEQQVLKKHMSARMLSQFLVVRSHDSPLRLEIDEPVGGQLPVKNTLGGEIFFVAVMDNREAVYSGENLPAGESRKLATSEAVAVRDRIQAFFDDSPLNPPPGFDFDSFSNVARMNQGAFNYYNQRNQNLPAAEFESSILERRLAKLQTDGIGALGPRSFVAIMRECPDVTKGFKKSDEKLSLYVVTGAW